MNELIIPQTLRQALPTMAEGILRAYELLQSVKSFEDVERLFLMGAGLSRNTYRAYLQAVKDFYKFTEGLNPLQVRPGDIELYFDDLVNRELDPKTINVRIAGLKKFFIGVRVVVPAYTGPFETMGEKLKEKLHLKDIDKGTKKSLNQVEAKRLVKYLRAEENIVDYAMIFFLLTSGLRASEMLSLKWEDLEYSENIWTAWFISKGGKRNNHEIYKPAVEAARASFQTMFKKDPRPDDHLFWIPASPGVEGDIARRMTYATLWHRVKAVGVRAVSAGIIRKSLEFSPHLFRRSYITHLYRLGMKLKALQKKSRHKNMSVLVDHYIDDSEPATPYLDKLYEAVS